MVKNLPANAENIGSIPCREDPLEKEMTTHSSLLAWDIPWIKEPDGFHEVMRSWGLKRVRKDLVTKQPQGALVETNSVGFKTLEVKRGIP